MSYRKRAVWISVLKDLCYCTPDYQGNMPCDEGVECDKCSANWVLDEYYKRLLLAGLK